MLNPGGLRQDYPPYRFIRPTATLTFGSGYILYYDLRTNHFLDIGSEVISHTPSLSALAENRIILASPLLWAAEVWQKRFIV